MSKVLQLNDESKKKLVFYLSKLTMSELIMKLVESYLIQTIR